MNRDEKATSHRGDRRPDRGRRSDLRGRLPGHQRPPGGRAARQAARGRRQLPGRQEPPDQTRRREGRRGAARRAAAGPDRADLRPRRHRPAAKAISTFNKEHDVLAFKGGFMGELLLDEDKFKSIARLPSREVLDGQLAGVVASPLTGLVRGLGSMIQGLALQLGQIAEKGLVSGEAPSPAAGLSRPEDPARPAERSCLGRGPPTAPPADETEEAAAEEEAQLRRPRPTRLLSSKRLQTTTKGRGVNGNQRFQLRTGSRS